MTGFGMTWIGYRKTFDMFPHSWLKKCIMLDEVAENMQKVLGKRLEDKSWTQ